MTTEQDQLKDILNAISNLSYVSGAVATTRILKGPDFGYFFSETNEEGYRNLVHTLILCALTYFRGADPVETRILSEILTNGILTRSEVERKFNS